jgi:hypothetical protein
MGMCALEKNIINNYFIQEKLLENNVSTFFLPAISMLFELLWVLKALFQVCTAKIIYSMHVILFLCTLDIAQQHESCMKESRPNHEVRDCR